MGSICLLAVVASDLAVTLERSLKQGLGAHHETEEDFADKALLRRDVVDAETGQVGTTSNERVGCELAVRLGYGSLPTIAIEPKKERQP